MIYLIKYENKGWIVSSLYNVYFKFYKVQCIYFLELCFVPLIPNHSKYLHI